jgi:iron complex outermembrane recepter protein
MNITRLLSLSAASSAMLVAAFGLPSVASAQPATTEAAPASVIGLEEIVVTAQRRSENLQRAAIAVTAVGAEDIARAGVTEATLQIGTIGGTLTQYYLRGVGNFTANSLSDAAVSINLDGVPIVRSTGVEGIFFDLERIEVLKGPQGTLYGRNATGGAVNVITAKPSLGAYSGYVNAEVGNYDALKLTAALNIPLGDTAAVRIAGLSSDHDGYLSDGTSDEELRAVRVQGLYEPNDAFRLIVGGDYAQSGGKGAGSTVLGLDRDDRIGASDPRAGAVFSRTFSPVAGTFLQPLPNNSNADNKYWGVFAQADIQTPVGGLTVIPSYRKSDIEYVGNTTFTINDRMKNDQLTFEARLASDDTQRLSYLLGAFYMDESIKQTPGYAEHYFNAHGSFDSDTTSKAVFGRLTFKVTDEFRLTGGIRYTVDEKKGLLDAYNILVVCPAFLAGGPPCLGTPTLPNQRSVPSQFVFPNGAPIPVQPWGTSGAIATNARVTNSASQEFTKTTYRVGFEYDLRPESLLYGTYETGFKAGGFFNSIDSPVYKPETIDAFTVGLKNRFWDNRLQLNLEGFFWKYKDQQVSHFRVNSRGGSEFVTENVGETEIKGLEVEARALVTETTTLSATVQYLDAERTDFIYTNPAAQGPPVTGCPFVQTGALYTINCSGTPAVNAPEWTINASLEQVFPIGDGRLTFNADVRYQSSYFAGFEQVPGQKEKAYTVLDLQLQYQPPGEHFSIGIFGNNVTDEAVVNYAVLHPFGPGLVAEGLRPPRTYGVRVGYKF